MKTRELLLLVATGLASTGLSAALGEDFTHSTRGTLKTREIVGENDISAAYDYVIAGGGLAGLVLASRLTERNNTVLVLEAGLSGDEIADRISECQVRLYVL